eukprot:Skav209353  [mRNA]  locus=scaffold241:709775:710569:- [translate_table: standard]
MEVCRGLLCYCVGRSPILTFAVKRVKYHRASPFGPSTLATICRCLHCSLPLLAAMALNRIVVALLFCCASTWAAPSHELRGAKGNVTAAQSSVRSSWQHMGCCNGCHTAFCSPQSGSCYDQKGKDYYLECAAGNSAHEAHADCCSSCSSYCSPQSGRCYDSKGKDYYLECIPSGPSGNFGTNVGDWEQLAGEACTQPDEYQVFYGISSRTECKEKCEDRSQFPWCRSFQFSTASASCGSSSMCKLLGVCADVRPDACWDYYFID